MKMKLLLTLLCVTATTYAQLPTSMIQRAKRIVKYNDYTGSIYRSINYVDASVIQENAGAFDGKVRYNIHSDRMEYESDNDLYEIKKQENIHVKLGSEYYYYCRFTDLEGYNQHGYYVMIELTDNYRIYKKYYTKIINPSVKSAVNNQLPEAGKIRVKVAYFLEEDNLVVELPMNKKALIEQFSDKKDQLLSYAKQQKIRFKKEEDLIRLISKYNALKNEDEGQSRSLLSNGF